MDVMQCLNTFVKIVDKGSLIKAAKDLDISSTVLSKRIAALEKHLGCQVLQRTTRRVSITPAGTDLYERGLSILENWQEAQTFMLNKSADPQGTLRVCIPRNYDSYFLPMVASFLEKYPDVRIELTQVTGDFEAVEQRYDLFIWGIKDMPLLDKHNSYKISTCKLGIYASPDYLKNHEKITSPSDLNNHAWLINSVLRDTPTKFLPLHDENKKVINRAGKLISNSLSVLLNAADAGMGLVYASEFAAANLVEQNRLELVLPEYCASLHQMELSGYVPNVRRTPIALDKFIEHLQNNS